MFFTLKSKSPSPTKVIQDIDDVLEAILKLCTDNMELLADEERSSFMDGFSRYYTYIAPSYTPLLTD